MRIVAACLILAGLCQVVPVLAAAAQLDRAALAAGELWRVATCHLAHWDRAHFVWDAATFLVLGWLCERRGRRRFALCLGVAALTIPLAILWLEPGVQVYRGLSGIDTALFALLGVDLLRENLRRRGWAGAAVSSALLLAMGAKLLYETLSGDALFVDCVGAGFRPLALAHVAGAISGGFLALAVRSEPGYKPSRCDCYANTCPARGSGTNRTFDGEVVTSRASRA